MVTTYFDQIVDDFGIWQHTDGNEPDYKEGYALDDATRGLLLCLVLGREDQADVLFRYIKQSFHNHTLYGFATPDRVFIKDPASEDATAQVVWAMGLCIEYKFKAAEALKIYEQAKAMLNSARYLRGPVYALLGAIYMDPEWAHELARDIMDRFDATTDQWPWPEQYLTYGNGMIPYALLRYGAIFNDAHALELGIKTLGFIDLACRLNEQFGPIGNDGWHSDNDELPAVYSQQPIDAAYMVWACLAAYEATEDTAWRALAEDWMSWFEGNNVAGEKIYDELTNKCYDGIDEPTRVNTNSGAESNICFLLSRYALADGKLF